MKNSNERRLEKLTRNLILFLAIIISTKNLNAQAIWNNSTFVHRSGQQILALGVTFPFNITIGMPLYFLIVNSTT